MRTIGHNNLPNIIGRWFPRRDERESHSFYCASMLLLLKPWRSIESDLKLPDQSWEEAFDEFMLTTSRTYRTLLSGIQYFHDCETSAKEHRDSENESLYQSVPMQLDEEDETEAGQEYVHTVKEAITEEGLGGLMAENGP